MEEINYVDSIPDYLINFIKQNEENIKNIIKEEKRIEEKELYL